MRARTIVPPDPIVTPADIPGAHAGDDPFIAGLIAAVTEQIDGPNGWLGRSLGPQTIKLVADAIYNGMRLPAGPVIDVVSIVYLDTSGNEQVVPDEAWRVVEDRLWFDGAVPSTARQPDAVQIEYEAGYSVEDGTGSVPERARQAIIVSAQHLKSLSTGSLYLKVDEVEGIGRQEFVLSEQAGRVVERACRQLLSTLWVPRV